MSTFPTAEIATSFLKTRQAALVCFVEGDDDAGFFADRLQGGADVRFLKCGGRDKVRKYYDEFITDYPNRVYAVCDADFLHLGYGRPYRTEIYITDTHDLILDTNKYGKSVERLIARRTDPDKYGAISPANIVDLAMRLSSLVGAIRIVIENDDNLNIGIGRSKIQGFVFDLSRHANADFTPNHEGIYQTILAGQTRKIRESVIQKAEKYLALHSNDLDNLCQGHDVCQAIAKLSDKINSSKKKISASDIEGTMHDLCSSDDFFASTLGGKLKIEFGC